NPASIARGLQYAHAVALQRASDHGGALGLLLRKISQSLRQLPWIRRLTQISSRSRRLAPGLRTGANQQESLRLRHNWPGRHAGFNAHPLRRGISRRESTTHNGHYSGHYCHDAAWANEWWYRSSPGGLAV